MLFSNIEEDDAPLHRFETVAGVGQALETITDMA